MWCQRRSVVGAFNCLRVFNRVNINWSISKKVTQSSVDPVASYVKEKFNYVENFVEYCNPINVKRVSKGSVHLSSSVIDTILYDYYLEEFLEGLEEADTISAFLSGWV